MGRCHGDCPKDRDTGEKFCVLLRRWVSESECQKIMEDKP